jgi:hypothetical protein
MGCARAAVAPPNSHAPNRKIDNSHLIVFTLPLILLSNPSGFSSREFAQKSPNLELEVQYPGFLVPWGGASKVPFSGSTNSHFFMWNLYASSVRISLTALGARAG